MKTILLMIAVLFVVGCDDEVESSGFEEPNYQSNLFWPPIGAAEPGMILEFVGREGKWIKEEPAEPNESEPKQPKFLVSDSEANDFWPKTLMEIIPTWPDYIELEKDLLINLPCVRVDITKQYYELVFPKGTKIYFKDDNAD